MAVLETIGQILVNCLFSISRVLVGVSLAFVAGVALGIWRSSLRPRVKNNLLIRFLFDAGKFPPPIAWIPFVILFFGIGEQAAWAIVFIGAFSPIFTNTFEGAESVPQIIRDTAHSMEISGLKFSTRIIFPATLPEIFTGWRNGLSMGWMSVIAAEMVAGQSGLGYSIQMNRLSLQHGWMTIDFILIGLIGFVFYQLSIWLEKKIVPWSERNLKKGGGS